MKLNIFLIACICFLSTGLHAQSIQLTNGRVVIGSVVSVSKEAVVINATYPKSEKRELSFADIKPVSLYNVLSNQIDQKNANDHQALAATSHKLGLHVHAIAEYRAAAALDSKLKEKNEKLIGELRKELAADLLANAKDAFKEGDIGRAKLNAAVIMEDYAETPSVAGASKILSDIMRSMKAEERAAVKSEKEARRIIEKAEKRAGRAQMDFALGTRRGTNKVLRQIRTSVRHLEKASDDIKDLGTQKLNDKKLKARIESFRIELKEKLHAAYVAVGTVYLTRGSLSNAEDFNVKACNLNAKSNACIELQKQIVNARIIGGRRSR